MTSASDAEGSNPSVSGGNGNTRTRASSKAKDALGALQARTDAVQGAHNPAAAAMGIDTALGESEARFRMAASTLPVLIWIAGLNQERTWFNEGWLRFTGRSLAEELGSGWTSGVHDDDRAGCVSSYAAGLKQRESFEIEYRLRRHDGEYRWMLDRGAPLHEPNGAFCGFIGGCLDVHDRVAAERALRISQDELYRITDALPALVAYIDAEERYRYVNRAFGEVLPPDRGHIVGRRLEEVHGVGEYCKIRPHVDAALRGEAQRFELCVRGERADAVRVKEVSCVPQRMKNGVSGFFMLGVDITERKRAELELRSREQQQAALARLAQEALSGSELQALCESAVTALAAVLNMEFTQVLDVLPGRAELFLRAGVGWAPRMVGHTVVSAALDSPPGYALMMSGPVVVQDLTKDTRFSGPTLLTDHRVVCGICCIVAGPSTRPWGVVGAYSREQRQVTPEDAAFVQAVAKILAAAVQREYVERSAHRLALLVESSSEAIVGMNLEQVITSWNRAAEEMYGYTAGEVTGQNLAMLKSPECAADWDTHFADLRRKIRTGPFETLMQHKDRRSIDVRMTLLPALDEMGEITAALAIGSDITARKRADHQVQMVIGELNHRMKNAVATIDAIAHQTVRHSESLTEFQAAFSQRLRALGQVHTLLIGTQWEGASLSELLEMELAARCPDRRQMDVLGPAVKLRPQVALPLHMVIHELCTNASKYGALSCQTGQVRVRWVVQKRSAGEHVALRWRERGGPAVVAPAKRGFGSTILESTVPYELEGRLKLNFRPQGLVCKLSFPLAAGASRTSESIP